MKRLLTALIGILLSAAVSEAVTVSVTGNIRLANGNRLTGTVRMTLSYPATDTTSGQLVSPQSITFRVNNGTVASGSVLVPNDVMAPANTFYVTQVFTSAGQMVRQNNFYVPSQGIDLGTATPTALTSSNISFLSFIGLTDVESAIINNRQTCARTGASAGAKIAAAIAALPSTGGTVDCQLPGNQTISVDVFSGVTKPVRLLLGAGTYTISATQTITNPYISIIGLGPFVTNVTCSVNADCIRATANPWTVNQAGQISGLTMDGNSGASAVGIHVSGIIGLALRDLVIENFSGTNSAGLWLDNGASFSDPVGNFVERTQTLGLWLNYNTVGLKFTVQAAAISNSFFYSHYLDMRFNVGAGQTGILMQGDGTVNGSPYVFNEDFHATINCINGGTMWKVLNGATLDINSYNVVGETTSGTACVGLNTDANAFVGGTGTIDVGAGASTTTGAAPTIRPGANDPGGTGTAATRFIESPNTLVARTPIASGGYGTYIMPDLATVGAFLQGIGNNLYFDGTSYKALGNGTTNNGGMLAYDGVGYRVIVTASTGGTTNTLTPAAVSASDRFSCSSAGCKIGPTASGATLLTIVLSASGNLNFGTINANTCTDVTFSLSGALGSDSYFVTAPVANVPAGIFLTVLGAATSAPTVRACNVTVGNVVVNTINTVRVDAWRH